MDTTEITSSDQTNGQVSMMAEFQALCAAHQTLQTNYAQKEEILARVYQENEEALKLKGDLLEAIKDASRLQAYLREKEVEFVREREEIKRELEDHAQEVEGLLKEKSERSRELSESLDLVKVIKQGLARVIGSMGEEGEEDHVVQFEIDDGDLGVELNAVLELVKKVGLKLDEFKEKGKDEKRELEYSLVSLTEENRDVNDLLRIVLVEKEAVEKSPSKLMGNNEQKRGAIFQIAERGLQKVGFGFGFMTTTELSPETTGADAATTSHGSEYTEDAVSLVLF